MSRHLAHTRRTIRDEVERRLRAIGLSDARNRQVRGDGHRRRRPDGRPDDPRRRAPPQGIAGHSFSEEKARCPTHPGATSPPTPCSPHAQPGQGAGDGRRLLDAETAAAWLDGKLPGSALARERTSPIPRVRR